jgi:hypothetical protein
MALREQDIPNALRALRWEPRSVDERTWRVTCRTAVGSIRVVVRYAGSWVYLTVLPFFDPAAIDPWGQGRFPAGFLGRLLAVNRNLNKVKFALDEDGDVVLACELPTDELTSEALGAAVLHLFDVASQYREPVCAALLAAAAASADGADDASAR